MIFNGQLKTNKVFASLFNMIISMQVFDTGISGLEGIYSSRKVDGTLLGDTKLYISTDALSVNDTAPGVVVDYNLLSKKLAPAPVEQAITYTESKQIWFTQDHYLSKQAFFDEGSFSTFNGVQLSWLDKTKEVYEHTKYTTDIVVTAGAKAKKLADVSLVAPDDIVGYDLLRWRGQELFRAIEDAVVELKEPSREYNDIAFLRNYNLSDFDLVIPLGILSNVRKHDVPFLFNEDTKQHVREVHWKYFGTKNTAAGTSPASNVSIRYFKDTYVTVGGDTKYYRAGDLVPNSTAYAANTTYTAKYAAKPSIDSAFDIFLIHKQDFPIMSAYVVGTSFFNAQRLDVNNYLSFGHNAVEDAHIGEYALLKLSVTSA